jgi:hypothetical protein
MANRSPRHTRPGNWNLRGKKSALCACQCCSVFNLRDTAERERVYNEEIRPATIGDMYPDLRGEEAIRDTGLVDTRPWDTEDRGIWHVHASSTGVAIGSDDFKFDVQFNIYGDFPSHEARVDYARRLANRLNRTIPE